MSYQTAQHLVRRILAVFFLIQGASILVSSVFLWGTAPAATGMRALLVTRLPIAYGAQGAATLAVAGFLWFRPWRRPSNDSRDTRWSPVVVLLWVGFATAMVAAIRFASYALGRLAAEAVHPGTGFAPYPTLLKVPDWITLAVAVIIVVLCARLPRHGAYMLRRFAAYPRLEPDEE